MLFSVFSMICLVSAKSNLGSRLSSSLEHMPTKSPHAKRRACWMPNLVRTSAMSRSHTLLLEWIMPIHSTASLYGLARTIDSNMFADSLSMANDIFLLKLQEWQLSSIKAEVTAGEVQVEEICEGPFQSER